MRNRIASLLALSSLMLPCVADAYLLEPRFEPPAPMAMQPVTMLLDAGGCTYLFDSPDLVDVSIEGSRIEVIIDAAHPAVEGGGCIDPITTYPYALGGFPLRDVYYSERTLYPSLQVALLRVATDSLHAIPAAGPVALMALLAGVALLSARTGHCVFIRRNPRGKPPPAR